MAQKSRQPKVTGFRRVADFPASKISLPNPLKGLESGLRIRVLCSKGRTTSTKTPERFRTIQATQRVSRMRQRRGFVPPRRIERSAGAVTRLYGMMRELEHPERR